MILNYYELLGLEFSASESQINEAYEKKVEACRSSTMKQRYDTAYYYLSDDRRRYKYDQSIGIHRYRKHSFMFRLIVVLTRFILSLVDAVMTFYWCFLVVIIVFVIAAIYMRTGSVYEAFDVVSIVRKYHDETYILALLALIDLTGHFYVRRANRFLKNNRELEYEAYRKLIQKKKGKGC